jgi:G3E family GTPase
LNVAETFTFDLESLDPAVSEGVNDLKDLSELDTCVTVVDASSF